MAVYHIDPTIRGVKVALHLGKNFSPIEGNHIVTHRLGPISLARRIKGIIDQSDTVELKHTRSRFIQDEGARVAHLVDGKIEIFDWWEEFGSLRFGEKRYVPLDGIKSDPELNRVLYYSPEKR